MSQHGKAYVILYHGTLCHNKSYVTTIMASLLLSSTPQIPDSLQRKNPRINTAPHVTIKHQVFNFIPNSCFS